MTLKLRLAVWRHRTFSIANQQVSPWASAFERLHEAIQFLIQWLLKFLERQLFWVTFSPQFSHPLFCFDRICIASVSRRAHAGKQSAPSSIVFAARLRALPSCAIGIAFAQRKLLPVRHQILHARSLILA
jgi:hypothetical protein